MNSAPPSRRAVIDVGTNSVKLLVADLGGPGQITPISEESTQTRLGAGFYTTHQLQPSAIAQTAAAVAGYSARAAKLGATSVRVIATSAARDARNAAELADAIREASGLPLEILNGEQEAEWAFRGVTSDARLAQFPALILDVGGGSTEFIVGENSVMHFCRSYSLGTVRLLEQLKPSDPPGLEALARCRALLQDFLAQQVAPELEPALAQCAQPPQLVGTSGTATILARMDAKVDGFDRVQIEATVLSVDRLGILLDELWQLSLSDRRKIPGLPSNRADVIATGLAIYEAIMVRFRFRQLRVSTRGLRYWALLART